MYSIFIPCFKSSLLSIPTMDPSQSHLAAKYKHFQEARSQTEINLTNHLTRALTQLNLRSIATKHNRQPANKLPLNKFYANHIFVCVQGIPPYPNEFDFLLLPGTILLIQAETFQPGLNEEQRKQRLKLASFPDQAHTLHLKIQAISQTRPLIFLFHSYGTYIVSTYFQFYPSNRITGIIDLGGAPIRFYPLIAKIVEDIEDTPFEWFVQNADLVHSMNNRELESIGIKGYESKYMVISFLMSLKIGNILPEIFEMNRNWPNVLKCIIYGRKDAIFIEKSLNEKAVHYCYKRPVKNKDKLLERYKEKYGVKASNIQERFIFNIREGGHSLHFQKKLQELLKTIVWQYLQMLAEVENQD